MRRRTSLLAWYTRTARGKRDGRWRFPVWVCFLLFLLLSPAILLAEGLACVGVMTVMTRLSAPPLLTLTVMAATMLIVACILAQLIYFLLRESHVEGEYVRCRRCGYNLTGNVSGRCPECGEAIAGHQRETVAGNTPDSSP